MLLRELRISQRSISRGRRISRDGIGSEFGLNLNFFYSPSPD